MSRQIDYKHEAIIKQLSSINRKLGTITGDGDSEEGGGDSTPEIINYGMSVDEINTCLFNIEYKLSRNNLDYHQYDNRAGDFIRVIAKQNYGEGLNLDYNNSIDYMIKITADKIPYFMRALHDNNVIFGSYGDLYIYDLELLSIGNSPLFLEDENGQKYEYKEYIEDDYIDATFNPSTIYLKSINTENAVIKEELSINIHNFSATVNAYTNGSKDNIAYSGTIHFININDEKFENGNYVWSPVLYMSV